MGEIIYTASAPEPVGPYSQAVRHNDIVYLSGQIAIDPKENIMVTGGIERETEQVLSNIKNVLSAAGSSIENVIKTTCFLVDLNEFSRFNAVYEKYFSGSPPARSTVEVSRG